MMELVAFFLGTAGIILLNAMLLIIRVFAQSHGLEVRWSRRSYAAERDYVRTLAESADQDVAKRARRYLRLEMAGWVMFVPAAIILLWQWANR